MTYGKKEAAKQGSILDSANTAEEININI